MTDDLEPVIGRPQQVPGQDASSPTGTGLKVRLGVFDLTCLGLNSVIGSGIFFTPGLVAASLGGYAPWGFLLGGLLCLAIGLCFGEMAGMLPQSGGAMVYARVVFGSRIGYLVGWVMWLSAVLGGGAVAVAFGQAWAHLLNPEHPDPAVALTAALGIVLALAAVNHLGVRSGAASNNLLAVAKMLPILAFMSWSAVGLDLVRGFSLSPLPPPGAPDGPVGVAWMAGFLPILYTFSGFEYIPIPGGEVRRPQRTIPLALVLVLLLSSVVYFVVQLAVCAGGAAGSQTPLMDAARTAPPVALLLGWGAVLSVASVNASIAFTTPRCLWALAWDGWLPRPLSRVHPTYATPTLSILVSALLTMVGVVYSNFQQLADLSVLASLLQYLPTILGVLVLRHRWPDRERPFRIPAAPLVCGAAFVVCVMLIVNTDPGYLKGLAVALALGVFLALFRPGAPEGSAS